MKLSRCIKSQKKGNEKVNRWDGPNFGLGNEIGFLFFTTSRKKDSRSKIKLLFYPSVWDKMENDAPLLLSYPRPIFSKIKFPEIYASFLSSGTTMPFSLFKKTCLFENPFPKSSDQKGKAFA